MYIAVKTVQKMTPVTEDMLMLVVRPTEGKENNNSEIIYTYSLRNRYNYDWLFEEGEKKKKGTSCQLTLIFSHI